MLLTEGNPITDVNMKLWHKRQEYNYAKEQPKNGKKLILRSLSEKLELIQALIEQSQETDLAHGTSYHTSMTQACHYCVLNTGTKAILFTNWVNNINSLHGNN